MKLWKTDYVCCSRIDHKWTFSNSIDWFNLPFNFNQSYAFENASMNNEHMNIDNNNNNFSISHHNQCT